jgi:hypothetical protein
VHVGSIIEAHLLRAKDRERETGLQDKQGKRKKVKGKRGNRELVNWRISGLGRRRIDVVSGAVFEKQSQFCGLWREIRNANLQIRNKNAVLGALCG